MFSNSYVMTSLTSPSSSSAASSSYEPPPPPLAERVIVFAGSFHGRTHMAMAMTTSKTGYRAGHSPLPGGVFVAQEVLAKHDENYMPPAVAESLRKQHQKKTPAPGPST